MVIPSVARLPLERLVCAPEDQAYFDGREFRILINPIASTKTFNSLKDGMKSMFGKSFIETDQTEHGLLIKTKDYQDQKYGGIVIQCLERVKDNSGLPSMLAHG